MKPSLNHIVCEWICLFAFYAVYLLHLAFSLPNPISPKTSQQNNSSVETFYHNSDDHNVYFDIFSTFYDGLEVQMSALKNRGKNTVGL